MLLTLYNLNVESNQNVESKRKSVESKNEKNEESKILIGLHLSLEWPADTVLHAEMAQ